MSSELKNKKEFTVLGLMSGTSMDGMDVVAVRFSENEQWRFEVLATKVYPYSDEDREYLMNVYNDGLSNVAKHSLEYAKKIAAYCNQFKEEFKIEPDLIASHGHTIFHQPSQGYTVQIGDGQVLANLTQVPTVSNFRVKDVGLGGQGAPLVPIGDRDLFHEYESCLNLGGFSNISFSLNGERVAFDIAPANLPLNYLMQKYFRLPYDKGAEKTKKGKVNKDLLIKLNNLPYYQLSPPKSLGFEWLTREFLVLLPDDEPLDLLMTISEHVGFQIGKVLNNYNIGSCLITGGGAYNPAIVDAIRQYSNAEIIIPSKEIIDFKEAIVFAYLGILNVLNRVNTLKSVTGAREDSCGGELFYPM